MAASKGVILRGIYRQDLVLPMGLEHYRYFRVLKNDIVNFMLDIEYLDTNETAKMSWEMLNTCVRVGD